MNALRTLLLLAAGLSVVLSRRGKALPQFGNIIQELTGTSFFWYLDYGCYCGLGGSGTHVDQLDSCCKVHDNCYGVAQGRYLCNSYIAPYVHIYKYSMANRGRITCDKNQIRCDWFICECDRKAAECFARSPYNPDNKHYNWLKNKCQ